MALALAACSRAEKTAQPASSAAASVITAAASATPAAAPKRTTNVSRWSYVGPPGTPPRDYWSVARGKDVFVVVGDAGSVVTSTDGATWTRRDIGASKQLSVVAYAEDKYFAAGSGYIFSSPDAQTWTKANAPGPVIDIASIPGKVLLASRGASFSSADGTTWARHAATDLYADHVVAGAGRFVAIGSTAGRNEKDADVFVFASTDGAKWSKQAVLSLKGETARSLLWAMDAFWMAAASGRIFRSADGASWSKVADVPLEDDVASALSYGSGVLLLAAGHKGHGCVHSSEDGRTWTREADFSSAPSAMTFGHGVFVIAAEANAILSSEAL